MSKSELKSVVFRRLEGARRLVPLEECAVRPYSAPDDVSVLFIDGSVPWAAGPFSSACDDLIARFTTMIERAFEVHRPHTLVMSFDKRRYVPQAKARTQAKRRSALEASVAAPMPEFANVIVAHGAQLPEWRQLRLNAAAFERAQSQLVDLLVDEVRVPASSRLIIDYGSAPDGDVRPHVIEMSDDALVRRHTRSSALMNDVGEADMLAQLVASAARGEPSRFTRRFLRSEFDVRRRYAPGNVVLWSVDTDYLTLSLLHAPPSSPYKTYVSLGRGAGTEREYSELYSIDAMRVGNRLSFAVFSSVCGNDYVDKVPGVSRTQLYAAYCQMSSELARRVGSHAVVEPMALLELLMRAYAAKLGQVAPERGDWRRLEADMTRFKTDRVLGDEQLLELYSAAQWSLDYSLRGPRGAMYQP